MNNHSVRPTDDEMESVVNTYASMLFRLCFAMLGSNADAEDAVSDTFIKYLTASPPFHDAAHQKAWLIKVAANICKDMHRFRKRHDYINLDDLSEYCREESDSGILEQVMRLPVKYKAPLLLFYIEGYKTNEIADILSVTPAAVRKRLQYGRDLLKLEYGKI